MKEFENSDEFADVLTTLIEAGLVDTAVTSNGEALFSLSATITEAGTDSITEMLTLIEPISDTWKGA